MSPPLSKKYRLFLSPVWSTFLDVTLLLAKTRILLRNPTSRHEISKVASKLAATSIRRETSLGKRDKEEFRNLLAGLLLTLYNNVTRKPQNVLYYTFFKRIVKIVMKVFSHNYIMRRSLFKLTTICNPRFRTREFWLL